MRVAIVGAGAMGSLYGGILAENGYDVLFVDVFHPHVDAVNQTGLRIKKENQTRTITGIRAVTDSQGEDPVDLIILFVKSIYTGSAMEQNRNLLHDNTLVLTLQNGLGNIEKLEKWVPRTQIIAGTSANGANMVAPGEIHHAGWGGTVIGELNGKRSERIRDLAELFNTGQLGPVEISDHVVGLIWDKLMANVGINPLTALTRLRNGELLQSPSTVHWMTMLVKEAEAVARAKGIRLSHPDSAKHCIQIAEATGENISSMLADILHKRRTEIDSINGAIVEEGKKLGIETPANAFVTDLVRGLEKSSL